MIVAGALDPSRRHVINNNHNNANLLERYMSPKFVSSIADSGTRKRTYLVFFTFSDNIDSHFSK